MSKARTTRRHEASDRSASIRLLEEGWFLLVAMIAVLVVGLGSGAIVSGFGSGSALWQSVQRVLRVMLDTFK